MEDSEFTKAIQKMLAITAVGPSALRSQGAPGVIGAARRFLSDLDIAQFSVRSQSSFDALLDDATETLRRSFPANARHWGAARKALNLFLRDAFYNHYLNPRNGLEVAEEFLEIPLDGVIAQALRSRDQAKRLPRWKGVKYLDREVSRVYQEFASELAKRYKLARVHLDALLWTEGR
jgi:hypothetical protein